MIMGMALIASLYSGGSLSGLVAGYDFDEGSGTTVADFSGNGNTGTISGNVSWVAGVGSQPLMVAGTPAQDGGTNLLVQADLQPIVQAAPARWDGVLGGGEMAQEPGSVRFVVTSLPAGYLGLACGGSRRRAGSHRSAYGRRA
jgi:hypothetical protein